MVSFLLYKQVDKTKLHILQQYNARWYQSLLHLVNFDWLMFNANFSNISAILWQLHLVKQHHINTVITKKKTIKILPLENNSLFIVKIYIVSFQINNHYNTVPSSYKSFWVWLDIDNTLHFNCIYNISHSLIIWLLYVVFYVQKKMEESDHKMWMTPLPALKVNRYFLANQGAPLRTDKQAKSEMNLAFLL